MLPRPQRLRAGADIARVSRAGSRARSGEIAVSLLPGDGEQAFRAAVVVGKRAGGAVTRNRIRRRIRHTLADLGASVPPGCELVVRSGPATASLTPADLTAELRSAVVRAGCRASAAPTEPTVLRVHA